MSQSLQCIKVDVSLDDKVEGMFTKFFFFPLAVGAARTPPWTKAAPLACRLQIYQASHSAF